MDINQLLWGLAGALGLAPGNLAIILGLLIFAANATSRLIPDTATGWLGQVRIIASWIGLHIRNNSGTAPVSTGVAGVVLPTESQRIAGAPAASIDDLVDKPIPVVKDAFGQGAKTLAMLVCLTLMAPFLHGCATAGRVDPTSDSAIAQNVCTHMTLIVNTSEATIGAAALIKDPTAQKAVIAAANAALNLVAACPGYNGPIAPSTGN